MFLESTYLNLLKKLHWGQIIRLKWFYESILNQKLLLAPYTLIQNAQSDIRSYENDGLAFISDYFAEGKINCSNNKPIIEIFYKQNEQYFSLASLIQQKNLPIPSVKEIKKIVPSVEQSL